MQADLVADNARGQYVALQQLAHGEHHADQDQQLQVEALCLHQRGNHRHQHAGGRAQVGDEADQAGNQANQQAQLEAYQRRPA